MSRASTVKVHGGGGWDVVDGRRETRVLPQAGPLEDAHLEVHALLVTDDQAGVLHEGGEGHVTHDGGPQARVVHKVDPTRSGNVVEGG